MLQGLEQAQPGRAQGPPQNLPMDGHFPLARRAGGVPVASGLSPLPMALLGGVGQTPTHSSGWRRAGKGIWGGGGGSGVGTTTHNHLLNQGS